MNAQPARPARTVLAAAILATHPARHERNRRAGIDEPGHDCRLHARAEAAEILAAWPR